MKKKGTNVKYTIPRKSPSPKKGSSSRKGPTPAEQDYLRKKPERKIRLMKEGKCIQCESDQHVIAECAEYAKIQAENRKRVEAQGKRWISWEEKKAQ